jgi:hypothetical protein
LKNFAEKIRSLIAPKKGAEKDHSPFEFVKSKKAILKELVISKKIKNVVGVYCDVLGEGMFLTAVEDIERTESAEIIVFYQYDITGRLLIRTRVELDKIQLVCPFNTTYENPLFSGRGAETMNRKELKTAASSLR